MFLRVDFHKWIGPPPPWRSLPEVSMFDHDVLIIGAGLAGMRAALAAGENGADVAVVTKVHPVRSHSNAAQGGINAALTDRGDDWKEHAYDTIKGSDYLGDQDAIEIMCQRGWPARSSPWSTWASYSAGTRRAASARAIVRRPAPGSAPSS